MAHAVATIVTKKCDDNKMIYLCHYLLYPA